MIRKSCLDYCVYIVMMRMSCMDYCVYIVMMRKSCLDYCVYIVMSHDENVMFGLLCIYRHDEIVMFGLLCPPPPLSKKAGYIALHMSVCLSVGMLVSLNLVQLITQERFSQKASNLVGR